MNTITIEQAKSELNELVSDINFWKETPSTYGFAFVIKNCQHGGVTANRYDFPTYESAVFGALEHAKDLRAQGFHYHGSSRKYNN